MVFIAYKGIAGSYTSQALENLCNIYKIELEKTKHKNFFKELFEEIDDNTLVLLPVENSITGTITKITNLFLSYEIEVIAETKLIINHCLICSNNYTDKDVKSKIPVYSHIQTLNQCSEFIQQENLIMKRTNDTIKAVKQLIEQKNNKAYAIGPEFATHIYGGKVLRRNIQNQNANMTRFLLIKKKGLHYNLEQKLPKKDKSSFIVELKNKSGQLYNVLTLLKEYNINISKLESHPNPQEYFTYFIIIDIEIDITLKKYSKLISDIEKICLTCKFLGSYPSWNI